MRRKRNKQKKSPKNKQTGLTIFIFVSESLEYTASFCECTWNRANHIHEVKRITMRKL